MWSAANDHSDGEERRLKHGNGGTGPVQPGQARGNPPRRGGGGRGEKSIPEAAGKAGTFLQEPGGRRQLLRHLHMTEVDD